jgi:hypothetical protein
MRSNRLIGALVSAMVCLPLHAHAQPATRIVSDPLFLPAAGQVYGTTAYTLSKPQGDNFKGGTQTGSFNSSNSLIEQTLAYGVTSDFTIRASMGYAANRRDSTSVATGDVTTGNSHGFADPAFSITYRVLDERRSPLVVDLAASFSPSLIDATSGGGGQDGNVARGGSTGGFSVTAGHEARAFTVAVTGGATAAGMQTTGLLSNGSSTLSDSHWNYDVALATQARFSERASLNAGVGLATTGSFGVDNSQKGNPRTSEGPDARAFNLALNYHLVPNRVVAALAYTYDSDTDSKNVFPNPASNTAVENRFGNVFGVRLLYVF